MTEVRVAYQAGFVGWADDQVAGDIVDKCRAMLLEEPATREDYDLAWVRYLQRYHGLECHAADHLLDVLKAGAPGFRTVANRCQELMRADAGLQPRREVMVERQRQRTQGRVR
jgi:hypothetical protein